MSRPFSFSMWQEILFAVAGFGLFALLFALAHFLYRRFSTRFSFQKWVGIAAAGLLFSFLLTAVLRSEFHRRARAHLAPQSEQLRDLLDLSSRDLFGSLAPAQQAKNLVDLFSGEEIAPRPSLDYIPIPLEDSQRSRLKSQALRSELEIPALLPSFEFAQSGILLSPAGREANPVAIPIAQNLDRIWLFATLEDFPASRKTYGAPVLEVVLEGEGGKTISTVVLRRDVDLHLSQLDRSPHSSDMESKIAFQWESRGSREHLDVREITVAGTEKVERVLLRNLTSQGDGNACFIRLAAITGGRFLLPSPPMVADAIEISGGGFRLRSPFRESFESLGFAIFSPEGKLLASRSPKSWEWPLRNTAKLDLSAWPESWESEQGLYGNWLLLREGSPPFAWLGFARQDTNAIFWQKIVGWLPLVALAMVLPLLIFAAADEISKLGKIRNKLIGAFLLTSVIPIALLLFFLSDLFFSRDRATRQQLLQEALQNVEQKMAFRVESASQSASAFARAFLDHPRIRELLAQPNQPNYSERLREELARVKQFIKGAGEWSVLRFEDRETTESLENKQTAAVGVRAEEFARLDIPQSGLYVSSGRLFAAGVQRVREQGRRFTFLVGEDLSSLRESGYLLRTYSDQNLLLGDEPGGFSEDQHWDFAQSRLQTGGDSSFIELQIGHERAPYLLSLGITEIPLNRALFLFAGFVGIGAFVVIRKLTTRMTKPIERLESIAKNLERGESWAESSVQELVSQSHDEVGELAKSFQSMATALARRFHLAIEDTQTGALNGNYFRMHLQNELEKATRCSSPLSVIRISFREIEIRARRQSLPALDPLLSELGLFLKKELPAGGAFGRAGHGDFHILFPQGNKNQALEFSRALQSKLSAGQFGKPPIFLTPKFAVATFPEDGQSSDFLLHSLEVGKEAWKTARAGVFDIQSRSEVLRLETSSGELCFRSPKMIEILNTVEKIAVGDLPVLIQGETGVGKEIIADWIHQQSARAQGPLIKLNCAAIPEALIEAELFGHEKGAFTGADSRRQGCFEKAHGGTLFLDEIGELPLSVQAKFLRVLQEKNFSRLGASAPIEVDIRVLAATNRDLLESLREGHLRSDLYYRLNGISLVIPPLRERVEEIPDLVGLAIARFNQSGEKKIQGLSAEAMDSLFRYAWPGNVRELFHVLHRACLLCEGGEIRSVSLDPEFRLSAPRLESQNELPSRQQQLIRHLVDQEVITTMDYVSIASVSRRTALRDLNELVEKGVLLRNGKRKAAQYRLAKKTN